MSDSVTQVTRQSWFSRLGGSIKGVLAGVVLFLLSFVVLWWNEGRAVKTAAGLRQLRVEVVSTDAAQIDPANEGRAVHLVGEAVTDEVLADPEFSISVRAVKLRRQAEMYQWLEEKRTEETRKVGGGSEKVTTYNYRKAWSERAIPSDRFQRPDGHENPGAMRVASSETSARDVTLGAFRLSPALLRQMSDFEPLALSEAEAAAIREQFENRVTISGNTIHLPHRSYGPLPDPGSPRIGDLRVEFSVVRPAVVSVIARQVQGTFEPWRSGSGVPFERLAIGTRSADELIGQMESQNVMFTWGLRLIGFLLMAFGLGMVFGPIAVLADVLPILGDLMRMGIGLFAMIIAAGLSLFVIAIAWLAYRPVLAVSLIVVSIGLVFGFWSFAHKRRTKAAATTS